jgi:hypothetical protein
MAVTEVTEPVNFIQKFVGLAGDVFPTDVTPGSEYFAYDTGRWYVTRDGTNWSIVAVA